MDQIALVGDQIKGVPQLIDDLKANQFNVAAAYWLYTTEDGQWYLYIVTDEIKQRGITDSYKLFNQVLRRQMSSWLDPFQVRLVSPDDQTAKAIMKFKSSRLVPVPWALRNTRLEDVFIENAYVFYI